MFYSCLIIARGKLRIVLLGEIRYVKSFVKLVNRIIGFTFACVHCL